MCIASLCCHTAEFDMLFYDMKDFGQASLQFFYFFLQKLINHRVHFKENKF